MGARSRSAKASQLSPPRPGGACALLRLESPRYRAPPSAPSRAHSSAEIVARKLEYCLTCPAIFASPRSLRIPGVCAFWLARSPGDPGRTRKGIELRVGPEGESNSPGMRNRWRTVASRRIRQPNVSWSGGGPRARASVSGASPSRSPVPTSRNALSLCQLRIGGRTGVERARSPVARHPRLGLRAVRGEP